MSHVRGRWPILSIEFMDGQVKEYEFSDEHPGSWESTAWDLIVNEFATGVTRAVRRVYPRDHIRCYSLHLADSWDNTLPDVTFPSTGEALDLSDAISRFQATTRREPGTRDRSSDG